MNLRQWIQYYKIRQSGVQAIWEVVGADSEISAGGSEVFNAIIQFTDHQGVVRRFDTDFIFGTRPKIGMKARMIYNYSNPEEAYFNRRGELFFLCLISILLLSSLVVAIRYVFVRTNEVL